MSTTGSRPTSMGPLIAAVSAVHQLWVTGVCVSYFSPYPGMGLCLAFSLMSNFPANPIQSNPALTFSQSMVTTAPCTVRVCLTGFCISQLWSYITWLLVYAVTWACKKVAYQVPSSSLPSVRFSPHRAILNLLNGHTFIHIAVVYGRIPATTQWWESCYLNQQVTVFLKWNFYSKNNFKILTCWLSTLPPSPRSTGSTQFWEFSMRNLCAILTNR